MLAMFIITLSEVVGLILLGLLFVVFTLWWIVCSIKQALCKHTDTWVRPSSLHTICSKCGKNLGFKG